MKSKFLSIGLCGMLMFTGCNSKGAGSDGDNISDSTVTDTAVALEESVEPQEAPVYLSADLKKFGLKGPVKKVTVKPKDYYLPGFVIRDLEFNPEGQLMTTLPSDFKIKVNDDGFIYKVVDRMGSSDGSQADVNYTLNEDGWPVTLKFQVTGPEEAHANLTLSYPEVDEHGNWTKCKIKGLIVTVDSETADEFVAEGDETFTRVITY